MRVSSLFSCLDSSNSLLGYCLAHDYSEFAGGASTGQNPDGRQPKQYYINTYARGINIGSNPYDMMRSPYDRLSMEQIDENLNSVLTEGLGVPTDTDTNEVQSNIYNGLNCSLTNGEFYFLRVPFQTKRITNEVIDITLPLATKGETYIFISSIKNDINFGEGLITTREYLLNNTYVSKVEGRRILDLLPPYKIQGHPRYMEEMYLPGSGRRLLSLFRMQSVKTQGKMFKKGNIFTRNDLQGTNRYMCIQDTWISDVDNFCPGLRPEFYLLGTV